MSIRHKGFTLIELLVVMAIIAMLLSLTMPRYFHSVDKSKEAALHSDLRIPRCDRQILRRYREVSRFAG